jgi:hypothetical protein
VWCESTNCLLINCVVISNTAAQNGAGTYSGTISNCTFVRNTAVTGGGAYGGILGFCTLENNSANNGGGACSNTLNACVLLANQAARYGGGAYGSTLNSCTIAWSTNAYFGAGISSCLASDCIISNNFCSGYYGGGADNSWMTNCVIVNNTASGGGGAYNSIMTNCTLSGNLASKTGSGGGGALQSTLANCLIVRNRAPAASGGAGYGCTFNNCLICSNSAANSSGTFSSTLNNCTIVGHTNSYAAQSCLLRNCIIYYNAANYSSGAMTNCCTSPLPPGRGNFTNAPLFVDMVGGNWRLLPNSPCINSGKNMFITTSGTDLDGNPRISGGTVDVGAYELQNPASAISYFWLQQYGLTLDGSADFADPDGDGMNNWQEWIAGTDPTNALSLLKLFSPTGSISGISVSWQIVSGKTYYVQRSTDLGASPAFITIRTNLFGQTGTLRLVDTSATNPGSYFYRVGVQQ